MKTKGLLGFALGVLFLVAALLVLPGATRAEWYAEIYGGGSQAANFGQTAKIMEPFEKNPSDDEANRGDFDTLKFPGKSDVAFVGGLKLGTWFVKEGFLGFNYPEWMKYFGFYLDFSYHRLDMRGQPVSRQQFDVINGKVELDTKDGTTFGQVSSNGRVITLAFMFAGRYGFFPDSEIPFGRLQPYVGVGPAIMFTSMRPKFFDFEEGLPFADPAAYKFSSKSSTNIALAAEAGVRWMCLKNVSVDLSFKYRFAEPSFNWGIIGSDGSTSISIKPTYHLFSGNLGVAYHF